MFKSFSDFNFFFIQVQMLQNEYSFCDNMKICKRLLGDRFLTDVEEN